MSSSFRILSKHSRSLSHKLNTAAAFPQRSFHSPFVVLNSASSTLTSPPSPSSTVYSMYEKQMDHSPEPQVSSSGTRTYVVSEPDPSHAPYEVPSGAYPTSAPYVNFRSININDVHGAANSSTSADTAHPYTTNAVSHNESGVGESAAVRHSEAPGSMGRRGGSHGGLDLMDEATTKQSSAQLADRNPAPDSDVAPKWSKLGVDGAWKERK
ncbi:hypothetical protein SERLA73DRAFT_181978 [Serpula lacrymans var. lacrymans S7.3]|uniref:Uncharacterized protein n=2 Tax=Serpula lacrymans var. lacrymans TaxID=341189 RepID=F8PZ33_SERL3|nr:uncharacterized protein SERLADRAFT_390385 [Serpula lacrymans var. lacrymans S7.9]EGN99146.1 hypothetical protein SERLA73DRAFT_181978 [Serpula lacrymans var. lacrymans S7.3]EGO24713.1 hypothetical protein SERLADRAFT_390385 [Serpula lacrymans var. lacrymans S7.9]